MIKLITGNLFGSSADIYAHGVNCQGRMASGVAKIIREKYPQAYKDYMEKFRKEKWHLGDVQLVHVGEKPRFIANCATQDRYGYDNNIYVSYEAVKDCMTPLFKFAARENHSVALPRIGAGLGGGDWQVIFNIINKAAMPYPDLVVEIYSLEQDDEF